MKKLLYGLFCTLIVLTGCTAKEETQVQAGDQAQTETKTESAEQESTGFEPAELEYYEVAGVDRGLTDVEKALLRKPGIYGGDNYDKKKSRKRWTSGRII